MGNWSHHEAENLYNVPNWSGGYFGINARGNVVVRPHGNAPKAGGEDPPQELDLHELIAQIRARGAGSPILLRFNDILRGRVRELHDAFDTARREYGYTAPYRGVFPIKVNQQRHLVDVLMEEGAKRDMGIEVGSKPELLAVMGLYATPGRLLICNGYKDPDYVETALLCTRLGMHPILVVEKASELQTILEASQTVGIRPRIGVRTKLGGRGAGRWKDSGGDRSKFGLTTRQIVHLVEHLRENDMLDCLELLHFHLGSQITRIRSIKNALGEATRTLTGLCELGAPIRFFDVGGGLGIDYDGSRTAFDSSMNYSLQEYANDVVFQLKEACEQAGIEEPSILSESGRALTAHHAVLISEVVGVSDFSTVGVPAGATEDEHDMIHNFAEVCAMVNAKNFQECYHDALELRDEGMTLFNVGQLSLTDRARIEEYFWRTCEKILRITRTLDYVPEELEHLEKDMADTYYLNFSVFQSMPDAWAIRQLFPVLPIHRNHEEPTRRAVLADITCDSDGKVDRFIGLRDVKPALELHPLNEGQRYYLGFFLVGAYQEILGDMHNLFGDTHVVHVDIPDNNKRDSGHPQLSHFVAGDRVEEVLGYVEYNREDLLASLRRRIERAIDEDRLSPEESAKLMSRYEAGLASYTYLMLPETLKPSPTGLEGGNT